MDRRASSFFAFAGLAITVGSLAYFAGDASDDFLMLAWGQAAIVSVLLALWLRPET